MMRCLLVLLFLGCGPVPKIREHHAGLAPWESMPPRDGVSFLEKFTHDSGTEPVYAALIEYETEADLEAVVTHFHLTEPHAEFEPRTRLNMLDGVPSWALEPRFDTLFVYRDFGNISYELNLWVDPENRRAVCERAWW